MNGPLTKLSEVEYTEVNCQDWDGKTDWTANNKGPHNSNDSKIDPEPH